MLTVATFAGRRICRTAVAGINGLHGLKYVKGKNKVLLVRPPNGVAVDESRLVSKVGLLAKTPHAMRANC
jgi:hypothetical protein